MTQVILNKGGTGEKTIDAESIQIPDLWHIAMKVADDGFNRESEMILDCWSLAHSLKKHITGEQS